MDDLLDITRTSEQLGKDAGHDCEKGKVTWISLKGEKAARRLASIHTDRARQYLESMGGDSEFLGELMKQMLDRQY